MEDVIDGIKWALKVLVFYAIIFLLSELVYYLAWGDAKIVDVLLGVLLIAMNQGNLGEPDESRESEISKTGVNNDK